jgi:hypothetical protein
LTQALALSNELCKTAILVSDLHFKESLLRQLPHARALAWSCSRDTYSLCDVINDNGTVGIAVVHGRERLVAFLTCSVPNLEFDGCGFVESDCLSEEGSTDG